MVISELKLIAVVGARPNFVKMAAILKAARSRTELHITLVHTGQHCGDMMSDVFFRQLDIPEPDIHLGVGVGSHAVQTAAVMERFDRVLDSCRADRVLVVGDVNSTLACALVAVKRHVPVAHVEAGLRSRDKCMPEEINRILTDQISDLLFTTEESAAANLLAEGIDPANIHFVGNVMVDTLWEHRVKAAASNTLERFGLRNNTYALCTLHRPSNVDQRESAERAIDAVGRLARYLPVVLPVHPRTRRKWSELGLLCALDKAEGVTVIEPLGYIEFLSLMDQAQLVLTDSGGIQEETTALGVPCLTYRDNTERPITVSHGTNRLVGTDPAAVEAAVLDVLARPKRSTRIPPKWDGLAAQRIVATLVSRAKRPRAV